MTSRRARVVRIRRFSRLGVTGFGVALMTVTLVPAVSASGAAAARTFHPAKPDLGTPVATRAVPAVAAPAPPASSRSVVPADPAEIPTTVRTVDLDRRHPVRVDRAGTVSLVGGGSWRPAIRSGAGSVDVAAMSASAPTRVALRVTGAAAASRADLAIGLVRADGRRGSAAVALRVPDALLAGRYGADYAARVRWVQVPADGSGTARPVDAVADRARHVTVLTPQVTEHASVLMATASSAATTGTGDFAAAPLNSATSWQVSQQTGAFTWSDPLRTPPPAAGPSPDVSLHYNSQAIDGETGSTNNQPSDEGEGWSLGADGAISRTYTPCATNDGPGGAITGSGDLCWGVDNATVSFAGHSGTLVPVGDGTWRVQGDDDTRYQYLTGTSNGTSDGDYWKVTTTDGTQYFFGLNQLPGWASGNRTTNSAFTVPVCGTATTACSGTATSATPFHTQAWKWNLDYVVDTHGNAEAFYYTQQTNRYAPRGTGSASYVRGGALAEIDYGLRTGNLFAATAASDKVVFGSVARCETGVTGEPSTACSTTSPSAAYWPDVPWDQRCTSTTTCTQKSPTFWSTTMLSTITTEYLTGTTYAKVDVWTLSHSWPSPGDGTSAALWLRSVAHSGYSGTTSLSTPTISFGGITMQNRVWTVNGLAPLDKYRISWIHTDTGAIITATYSPQQCTPSMISSLTANPAANDHRCFPQWWTPKTTPAQAAGLDWFHKYVVTAVYTDPVTGGTSDLRTETDYVYTGTPAWRFNTAPGVQDSQRTWSDWAGYDTVEVRVGDAGHPALQRTTDYTYFRGLDGDAAGSIQSPTSSTRTVVLTSSTGVTVTDRPQWAGQVFETVTRLGSSGGTSRSSTSILTDAVSMPWSSPATATTSRSYSYTDPVSHKTYNASLSFAAYYTGTASTVTTAPLSAGGTRTTSTSTSYDDDTGLPTSSGTHAYDTSATGSVSGSTSTCTTTTYAAKNASAWLIGLPARSRTVGVACGDPVTYPADSTVSRADVLNDVATYYDGSTTLADAPTRGDATQTAVADGYSGDTPQWLVTGTATYDALGRAVTSIDPNAPGGPATTTTSYTPATAGPTTSTSVTNPLGWKTSTKLAPAWGAPIAQTDQNGGVTTGSYDALGRLISVWLPNRATTSSPSTSYGYAISTTSPSALRTTALTPSGGTRTSYTLVDGLGRVRQTQSPAEGGGIDVVDTSYDGDGNASVVSAPYYATGTVSATLIKPTTTLPSQTQSIYDGAGRVTASVLLVDNHEAWRTSTSYLGADRTDVTPPDGGTPTTTYTNATGKTSLVRETVSSTSSTATAYGYDAADEMTSMRDDAGNAWSWTFNVRGQLIRSVDPDTGTTSSTFDPDGNRISTTDAVGNTITDAYDRLGRKTSEFTGSGPDAVEVASWQFDRALYSTSTTKLYLGLVSSATSFTGGTAGQPGTGTAYSQSTSAYDTLGNPLKQTTTIGGTTALAGSYVTSYGYNADGTLAYQNEPAAGGLPNETVYTGYDALGNPGSLATPVAHLVSSVTYTHLNQVAQVAQIENSQVYQTPSYNAGTGRLVRYLVQRSATTNAVVADDRYTYDNAGLITEDQNVTPAVGTDTQCFTYDRLQNLTQAWTPASNSCVAAPTSGSSFGGPAPYWSAYQVDPSTGNRATTTTYAIGTAGAVSGSDTATYRYPDTGSTPLAGGAGGPHAVSTITHSNGSTQTYSYDLDGAVTSLPGHTITYNAQEKPALQRVGQVDESDVHDADGNLLLSDDATSGTTLYLADTQLHAAPGAARGQATGSRTYSLAGTAYAERDTTRAGSTASSVSYLVANPQGTATAAVNDATAAVTRRYYDPFGTPRGHAPAWPDATARTSFGNHGFLNAASDLLTSTTGSGTDAITQLGARQYDPTLGRFLSVDPLLDTADPQSINGYAYANNDPVAMSDPAGTDPSSYCMNHVECMTPTFGGHLSGCQSSSCADHASGADTYDPDRPVYVHSRCQTDSQCSNTRTGRTAYFLSPKYHGSIPSNFHLYCAYTNAPCQAVLNGTRPLTPAIDQIYTTQTGVCGVSSAACNSSMDVENHLCSGTVGQLFCFAVVGLLTGGLGDIAEGAAAADALETGASEIAESEVTETGAGEAAGAGRAGTAARACANSFTADTLVTMADGTEKPIKDVKVGDKVLATDPDTSQTVAEPVQQLIRHSGTHTMVLVTLADGSVLNSTGGHPIWDATTEQFTDANKFRVGDKIETAGGTLITVTGLIGYTANLTAYNLQISTIHTYYAGTTPILVHNSCGVPEDSDLGRILSRGARTTNDTKALYERLYKEHGLDPHVASNRLHALKDGIEGNPDVVLTRSGGVYDATSGDHLGDLLQG